MPTSPTFPTLDGGPREPDTNQPSPVLTAEEREEGNQHVKNLRTWARTHPWLETPASWIVRVLSRTADPDTVTLPDSAILAMAAKVADRRAKDATLDIVAEKWWGLSESLEAAANAAKESEALAIHQAQGGDDE